MKSKTYWIRRSAALEKALQKNASEVKERIVSAYERAVEDINEDIRKTFKAYVSIGVPEAEAKRLLNAAEHDKLYTELVKLYNDTDNDEIKEELLARMNARAYGARISRLEGVKERVYIRLRQTGNYAEKEQRTLYTDAVQKSFYSTIYNIAEGIDAGIDFSLLPAEAIGKTLREPWKGNNFSHRIWTHNKGFIKAVQQTVEDGIIAGHDINRMASRLEEWVKSTSPDSVETSTARLVRTETAHFMNQGQLEAYENIGIEKYQFVAALSERTCDTCGGLDGEIFSVSEAHEGENYPPIHPNCRCTTVMADTDIKERIARNPETGQNYKVDGSMTFEEWKENLTPEQKQVLELTKKKDDRRIADKRQYAEYKHVLGEENIPKTFASFRSIKENHPDRFNELRAMYREKNVDKSAGSGIINMWGGRIMNINNIDSPIEQRNTGKGNPNAILHANRPLNNRQKRLLEKLPEYDSSITIRKKDVNMKDLSALTAHTGDEYAIFTKGKERLVIRGNSNSVNVDIERAKWLSGQGYKWSGHTHPGIGRNCLQASVGDKEILRCFKQEVAYIYNSQGDYLEFWKE